jgi:hypothetical protein
MMIRTNNIKKIDNEKWWPLKIFEKYEHKK